METRFLTRDHDLPPYFRVLNKSTPDRRLPGFIY